MRRTPTSRAYPKISAPGLWVRFVDVANDFTVLAQRLDPQRLKEIVARYSNPEEAERAENAIEVSPTGEPADVIDPDDCDGVLVD